MPHQHTVAHVDTELGFSGGEVQVFLLMQGLARRGVRNVLFCPPGSRSAARAAELGLEVQTLRMRNDLHLSAVVRLAVRFAQGSVELVHLHTGRANWLGGLAARAAGVPAITTRRMDRPLRRGPLTRFLYGQLVRRAVAISPAVASLLAAGGVPAKKTRTIPSSVDPQALLPRVPREQTRAAAGLAEGDVLLLALANLTRRKGLDVLLEALALLAARRTTGANGNRSASNGAAGGTAGTRTAGNAVAGNGVVGNGAAGSAGSVGSGGSAAPLPRLVLWIAGTGQDGELLRRRASDLGLLGQVRFLGQREDAPDLLAACDLFVMPSRQEGLGIAALEAMAAGRPVIGSRVGGLANAVVDGQTGLLVPPEDPAALAAALERAVRDGDLRQRLGRSGPERIRQGFHADQMVESYLALYREVLEEVRVAW